MNESQFSHKIVQGLEGVGAWIMNVHGHRFQKSGIPDLYVAHNQWTGWVEFKVGSGKPTDLQIMKMKDLLVRNVPAFVVRLRDGVIYCELWSGGGKGRFCETLSCCELWGVWKGQALGMGLLKMFDDAGAMAIEIIRSNYENQNKV